MSTKVQTPALFYFKTNQRQRGDDRGIFKSMANSADATFIKYISGGNHELFHSNLLAFLAKQCPDYFRAVFEPELGADFPFFSAENVCREKNNFDVSIEIDGSFRLVLENKMKSIPTAEQLERYEDRANKKRKEPKDCKFILLTLIPMERCPGKWKQVSYHELSFRMYKHLQMLKDLEPTYLIDFVKDYISFIGWISNLVTSENLFDIKTRVSDLFKVGIDSSSDPWLAMLEKKLVFSRLANSIVREIDLNDHIYVGTNIVRGSTPLVEIWFRFGKEGLLDKFDKKPQNSFWIQISNGEIHRGFLIMNESLEDLNRESKPKGKNAREDFLKEIYNQCMALSDFTLLKKAYEGLNILPDTADNLTHENLHGYIYDHLVMVYKIEKIEDPEIKSVSDLVEKIAKEANDILTNCKPINNLQTK